MKGKTPDFVSLFVCLFFACPSLIVPAGCLDSNNQFHIVGSSWNPDSCTHCFCPMDGEMICAQMYCDLPPPYCGIDPVQDPESCCPSYTCPESKFAYYDINIPILYDVMYHSHSPTDVGST